MVIEQDESSSSFGGVCSGIDALGNYHLVRPIGAGGMGRVYLAVDARSGRAVALKRMLPELAQDAEHRRAFSDEATVGLCLRHPNIVETIELACTTEEQGAELHLALELLHGRPLSDVLDAAEHARRAVPVAVAMCIVRDVARGLHHAHTLSDADGQPLSIVHRDVTPHNVFLCTSGVTKLVDFGVAKTKQQRHLSVAGTIKGKLNYLAPEQLRGLSVDARSDLFSLGVVLYEMLTGVMLFDAESEAETLYRIVSHQIAPPDELRADLPRGLSAIVMRALHRDRDRRLPSAEMLACALEAVAEAEQIALSSAKVAGFARSLFPDDARRQTEDASSSYRLFAHLRSQRRITTPAAGVNVASRRARRAPRGFARAALIAALLSLTAFAGASVLHLLAPPARSVMTTAPEELRDTRDQRPPPLSRVPRVETKRRRTRDTRCKVYITLANGPTTVCADGKARRRR